MMSFYVISNDIITYNTILLYLILIKCRSLKTDCSILFGLGAIIALLFGTVQISRSSGGGFAGQVRERRRKSERDKEREN